MRARAVCESGAEVKAAQLAPNYLARAKESENCARANHCGANKGNVSKIYSNWSEVRPDKETLFSPEDGRAAALLHARPTRR
jgi:hypothetical protein